MPEEDKEIVPGVVPGKIPSYVLETRLGDCRRATGIRRSSRFGRLHGVNCAVAARNLYMRFTCSPGDALGMNMVSKGVLNLLDYLQDDFPNMDAISISGSE
ncbi:3-hydroxy-3-methylglutaryl-coenzyme A reductase 3-like [Panicum miliaceum]|uniref:3-hydroxy-3-methylglutaryl-coenzyme A reductase 3-like n=1 Tax=Panicum miliaceum TaxID=4540 RepID=A0A3L6RXH4_PANMI|nr:3-hydroxy-3-methylglutaryl-coenzyme A reductase 3-like [Panicum miliaceum]